MSETEHAVRAGIRATLFLALALASWCAPATHETDHRYLVQGFVLDDQRQPRPGVTVSVSKDGDLLGQTVTDGRGRFSLQVHLHDQDIGSTLVVRAGGSRGEIRMQATPGDTTTRRVHHVSFIGGGLVEGELSVGIVSTWMYIAGGGAVAALAVGFASARARRKKRKAAARKADSKKRRKPGKRKSRRK
ncbi:MAG: GGIII-like transmembrane region-containing protein [Gammaproteobacteria bacterium]|nr:GGIII-like transmembrane region-containing protein [Gammaproteobacteria bacterium]